MACGGCKKGKGTRHTTGNTGDLRKFAFLSPRQLRMLKETQPEVKGNGEPDTDSGE